MFFFSNMTLNHSAFKFPNITSKSEFHELHIVFLSSKGTLFCICQILIHIPACQFKFMRNWQAHKTFR